MSVRQIVIRPLVPSFISSSDNQTINQLVHPLRSINQLISTAIHHHRAQLPAVRMCMTKASQVALRMHRTRRCAGHSLGASEEADRASAANLLAIALTARSCRVLTPPLSSLPSPSLPPALPVPESQSLTTSVNQSTHKLVENGSLSSMRSSIR